MHINTYIYTYTVLLHSGVIKVSVYSTPDWWKLHVLFNVSTCKAIPPPHMHAEREGVAVLSYANENQQHIKTYQTLKTENDTY